MARCVAIGQAVAGRPLQNTPGVVEESIKLGDHALMLDCPGGRIAEIAFLLRLHLAFDEANTIPGQGMASEIGIFPGRRKQALLVQNVKELGKAGAGDADPPEIAHAGLVSRLLLAAGKAEKVMLSDGLAAGDDRGAESRVRRRRRQRRRAPSRG